MSPRAVAAAGLVLYAGLLAAGVFAVLRREPAAWTRREPMEWRAARDLPALAQVDSADLAAPRDTAGRVLPSRASLVGRHLAGPKRRGEPITRADVAPLRVGRPPQGKVRFVVAARAGDALVLAEPGEVLTPCIATAGAAGAPPAWDCAGAALTLVALHRRAAGDSLWAVLDAATADGAARFAGAANRMLVRMP
jgi:hypothetical protein